MPPIAATLETDLSAPLSGTVALAARLDHAGDPETWGFVTLDGARLEPTIYAWHPSAPGSMDGSWDVDTTTLADGPHVLDLIAWAIPPGAPYQQWHSPSLRRFVSANGPAYRGPWPRWQEVRLAPGGSVALGTRDRLCDGTAAARPATDYAYSTSDAGVATVSADGAVSAVAAGAATIEVSRAGRSRDVRVLVLAASVGCPHLARDGGVLHAYTPGRSVIVRSVFGVNTVTCANQPGLVDAARGSGLNALDQGFYLGPSGTDEAAFLASAIANYDDVLGYCAANGMMIIAGGDNWARGADVLAATLAHPWTPAATDLALSKLRDSRLCPMIEVVDEATTLLGATPPAGVSQLMAIFNATAGRPPVAWSTFSLSGADAIANWEGLGDYHSWMSSPPGWAESIAGFAVATWSGTIRGRVLGGRTVADNARPMGITNISITGPSYRKLVAGSDYAPGRDHLIGPGVSPDRLCCQVMTALALGATALRAFQYDAPDWVEQRAGYPLGTDFLYSGAAPAGYGAGAERWAALSACYRAIAATESHLLQPIASAVNPGPEFLAGARKGPLGAALIVVNVTDAPATADVDLTPYRLGDAGRATRRRVRGAGITTEDLPPGGRDVATLRAGEALIYTFRGAV